MNLFNQSLSWQFYLRENAYVAGGISEIFQIICFKNPLQFFKIMFLRESRTEFFHQGVVWTIPLFERTKFNSFFRLSICAQNMMSFKSQELHFVSINLVFADHFSVNKTAGFFFHVLFWHFLCRGSAFSMYLFLSFLASKCWPVKLAKTWIPINIQISQFFKPIPSKLVHKYLQSAWQSIFSFVQKTFVACRTNETVQLLIFFIFELRLSKNNGWVCVTTTFICSCLKNQIFHYTCSSAIGARNLLVWNWLSCSCFWLLFRSKSHLIQGAEVFVKIIWWTSNQFFQSHLKQKYCSTVEYFVRDYLNLLCEDCKSSYFSPSLGLYLEIHCVYPGLLKIHAGSICFDQQKLRFHTVSAQYLFVLYEKHQALKSFSLKIFQRTASNKQWFN